MDNLLIYIILTYNVQHQVRNYGKNKQYYLLITIFLLIFFKLLVYLLNSKSLYHELSY